MKLPLIVITGFMGSGKTAVARAFAETLQCPNVDLDQRITEREGRSANQIIRQEGEAAFRQIETSVLSELLASADARVVALGGGTWIIPENRLLITRHEGLSVWLDAPFELCWRRILAGSDERPLAPSESQARELYQNRRASYALAQVHVGIKENESIAEICAEIHQALNRVTD